MSAYVSLQDFIYVHDNLNGNLPLSLTGNFSLVNNENNTVLEV